MLETHLSSSLSIPAAFHQNGEARPFSSPNADLTDIDPSKRNHVDPSNITRCFLRSSEAEARPGSAEPTVTSEKGRPSGRRSQQDRRSTCSKDSTDPNVIVPGIFQLICNNPVSTRLPPRMTRAKGPRLQGSHRPFRRCGVPHNTGD